MRQLLAGLLLMLAAACATTPPAPFETGGTAYPPYGCMDLRKERADADC